MHKYDKLRYMIVLFFLTELVKHCNVKPGVMLINIMAIFSSQTTYIHGLQLNDISEHIVCRQCF